ncbi:MAG: Nuclease-related domain protein [Chloroflexi bacterium ADurb.Bin360]|nr:MAG: Nuclease-related domain protein [Chloroflexi bacterium ADurb.Bin360]
MKKITLSTYVADQGRKAANKRQADYDIAARRYTDKMAARAQKKAALREKSQLAFRQRRFFAWFVSLLARLWHKLSPRPQAPAPTTVSQEEDVWNAGEVGEQRVITALSRILPDDWTLLTGYRNPRGEIDQLLVGPPGILAIESKFINGRVSCDGDTWWRDKYDSYGNQVEKREAITDKRGRGPSAQVNAAADRLQETLSKRSPIRSVARAVVFTHDRSIIESLKNTTVDLVTTLPQLNRAAIIAAMKRSDLAGMTPAQVVELIQRDHDYHQRAREERVNPRRYQRR